MGAEAEPDVAQGSEDGADLANDRLEPIVGNIGKPLELGELLPLALELLEQLVLDVAAVREKVVELEEGGQGCLVGCGAVLLHEQAVAVAQAFKPKHGPHPLVAGKLKDLKACSGVRIDRGVHPRIMSDLSWNGPLHRL